MQFISDNSTPVSLLYLGEVMRLSDSRNSHPISTLHTWVAWWHHKDKPISTALLNFPRNRKNWLLLDSIQFGSEQHFPNKWECGIVVQRMYICLCSIFLQGQMQPVLQHICLASMNVVDLMLFPKRNKRESKIE